MPGQVVYPITTAEYGRSNCAATPIELYHVDGTLSMSFNLINYGL